ncbi:hypothetical protein WR25_22096 [Diploscapter pachys]|uniref:ZMIZ1/ZMIZ2 GBD-like domain-containing protein n=1 Tax=Diploscapter pachys TaxID=2018661 RepID=A0A2A2LWJ8_9BILA|nr:hypothetical protein WR25_22096 [Diploscapter pachys]
MAGSSGQQPSPSFVHQQPGINYNIMHQQQQSYGNMYPMDGSQMRPGSYSAQPMDQLTYQQQQQQQQQQIGIMQSTQAGPQQNKTTGSNAKGRGRGRQNSSNSLNGGGTSTEISGMAVAGGMQTGQGQFEQQQQMYASTSGTASAPGQPTQPLIQYPPSMGEALQQQQSGTQMIRAGPPVMFGQMGAAKGVTQQQVSTCINPYSSAHLSSTHIPAHHYMLQQVPFIPFPVQPLLTTFSLAHEQVSCTQQFLISPEVMRQLQSSECIDVMARSVYRPKEDRGPASRMPLTKWPCANNEVCIKLFINNTDCGVKDFSRAVFVKNLLRIGQNEMQIFQTSCACDHFFSLTLVNRLPLPQAIQMVINSYSHVPPFMRIKQCKDRLMEIGRRSSQPVLRIPLSSPNSARRLSTPARHKDCSAVFCFELEMALLAFQDAEFIHCSCCTIPFAIGDLEVDWYVGSLLAETRQIQPTILEVNLDILAGHCPVGGQYLNNNVPRTPMVMMPNMQNGGCNQMLQMQGQMKVRDAVCMQQQMQMQQDIAMRKRGYEDSSAASFPIKRIRSEQCVMVKQEGSFSSPDPHSPFPMSVPNGLPFGQSPANMLSPHANFSPQKPPTHCEPNVNGAMTSPSGQTAASNGPTTTVQLTECSGMASTSSTSPNGGTHANHGSIEQASLNGSAPYTPSSVGSHAHSGIAQGIELSRTCNASAAADPVTSLNNLDASELIKFDQAFDHSQFVRYLKDMDGDANVHGGFDDLHVERNAAGVKTGQSAETQTSGATGTDCSLQDDPSAIWADVLEIINADIPHVQ